MDATDKRILRLLQENAGLSLADLASCVGLSTTPVWRRVKALEEAGVIVKRTTLLDAGKLGLGVTVFVGVRTNQHTAEWLERFAAAVASYPEVTEVHRLSGETDYLLKVVVADIQGYDRFYKKLIAIGGMTDVSSSFAMEQIKYTTALPIE
ncbi:MAG: Lrp/AsnC family transcriptional regulator [Alphaproteobacteria bacterium]|nr:Lrp/AsnC family transcriptional regulator [Alphaproteobacteria bacterium]